MRRRFRLTGSNDFQRVRRFGKSYAHPLVVLVVNTNESGKSRFAVSAGRSIGNAVQRNRAKRLLREALRPLTSEVAPGWDVVLLARRPMADASLEQVQEAIRLLLQRSRLLEVINGERS